MWCATTRRPLLWLVILEVITGIHCGRDLPKTIKVTGEITFDGHPPPASGVVYFLPQEAGEGFPARPAIAHFDKSGRFEATTFEPGDGLMPGKYGISIECWQTPPNMEGKPVKSYLPQKYQSAQTSGLELTITPDMKPQHLTLDINTK